MSHPARVRGLKQISTGIRQALVRVAPCTGAWIETKELAALQNSFKSHPARVRGLTRIYL